MNVIFLDIDGVMNSNYFYYLRHKKFKNKIKRYWNITIRSWIRFICTGSRCYKATEASQNKYEKLSKTFDYKFNRLRSETCSIKWKWLVEFCNRTNTKICVSSCWKHHFHSDRNINNEWWDKAFCNLGFNNDTFVGITGTRQTLRGDEIKDWIEKYNSDAFTENHFWHGSIEKYAIIDDDSDMLPEQMDSFFHVDGYYGLSPNTLYRIGIHFNKKEYNK